LTQSRQTADRSFSLKVINEQEVSGAAVGRGCNSSADKCHV
jgi:hypothetical protein